MQRSQVVVITGASAGIGRATARAFADEGARVALLARDEARLEETLAEVRDLGGDGTAIVTDVADPDQVEAAAKRVEAELGPIDIWINNAMTTVFGPVHAVSPEEARRVTEVTYLGTVYGTLAALKRMRERDRGVIVQVGSALAYRGIPLQAAYCGAKHAVQGFTESLRTELLHDGSRIHLTMVQLAAFNTPQFSWSRNHTSRHPHPLPPIYQPELAAKAILWAAQHRRRELQVGAATVTATFWNKFFPGLVDRSLAITAYEQQMADMPADANEPGNLFDPVLGDFAAHGVFDQQAKKNSLQFRLATLVPVPAIPNTLFALAGGVRSAVDTARMLLRRRKRDAETGEGRDETNAEAIRRAA